MREEKDFSVYLMTLFLTIGITLSLLIDLGFKALIMMIMFTIVKELWKEIVNISEKINNINS